MVRLLTRQLVLQRLALFGCQPFGLTRPVGEQPEDGDAEDDRGNGPQNVNPLPAGQAKDFRMINHRALDDLLRAELHPLRDGICGAGGAGGRCHNHPIDFMSADLQNLIRDNRIHDLRHRCGDEEIGQRLRPVPHGKPVGEVHNDAREEARLRKTEQEAHGVELERRGDRRGEPGH